MSGGQRYGRGDSAAGCGSTSGNPLLDGLADHVAETAGMSRASVDGWRPVVEGGLLVTLQHALEGVAGERHAALTRARRRRVDRRTVVVAEDGYQDTRRNGHRTQPYACQTGAAFTKAHGAMFSVVTNTAVKIFAHYLNTSSFLSI